MDIPFYKCDAYGNTFIIVYHNNTINKSIFDSNKINKICSQIDKAQIDGFILLNILDDEIQMDYYNNDGTWETFCLNGLRCSALLLSKELNKNSIKITCNNKIYSTKILNDKLVQVNLSKPIIIKNKIEINKIIGSHINSGANHFVINYKFDWPTNEELEKLSKKIRYNKKLFPNGINVNYYKILKDLIIEVKTYEKGIESMMKSCASGSYACAYDYCVNNNLDNQVKIINDGGKYKIIFNKNLNDNFIIGKVNIGYKDKLKLNNG